MAAREDGSAPPGQLPENGERFTSWRGKQAELSMAPLYVFHEPPSLGLYGHNLKDTILSARLRVLSGTMVEKVSFNYTDKGKTRMYVFREYFPAGHEVSIPQTGWAGTMVLTPR